MRELRERPAVRTAYSWRYFSSSKQESVHGGASRQDAEVAMILAHPGKTPAELESILRGVLGTNPRSRRVTDLVLHLRDSEEAQGPSARRE